jgi:hypothetical protein
MQLILERLIRYFLRYLRVAAVKWFLDLDIRLSAALIAAVVSLTVALLNNAFAVIKFRSENTLSRQTERAIRKLIKATDDRYVPFRIICHHIGGYSDDELRRILVRCGALRFADTNMVEHWALLSTIPRKQRSRLTAIEIAATASTPPSKLFPIHERGSVDGKV